jgi:hypothetical protein
MDIFPLLDGWKKVIVNSPLYSGNVITVNNVYELANFNGTGWLYSVTVVSTDPNMLLRIIVDGAIYESTPHLTSIFNESFEHFTSPAYNISYNNTYIYAIKYYNKDGTAFKNNINISIIPSGSSMQVFEYDVEFVTITDINAFISSYNRLYFAQASPTSSQPPSSSGSSANLPSTDICYG